MRVHVSRRVGLLGLTPGWLEPFVEPLRTVRCRRVTGGPHRGRGRLPRASRNAGRRGCVAAWTAGDQRLPRTWPQGSRPRQLCGEIPSTRRTEPASQPSWADALTSSLVLLSTVEGGKFGTIKDRHAPPPVMGRTLADPVATRWGFSASTASRMRWQDEREMDLSARRALVNAARMSVHSGRFPSSP